MISFHILMENRKLSLRSPAWGRLRSSWQSCNFPDVTALYGLCFSWRCVIATVHCLLSTSGLLGVSCDLARLLSYMWILGVRSSYSGPAQPSSVLYLCTNLWCLFVPSEPLISIPFFPECSLLWPLYFPDLPPWWRPSCPTFPRRHQSDKEVNLSGLPQVFAGSPYLLTVFKFSSLGFISAPFWLFIQEWFCLGNIGIYSPPQTLIHPTFPPLTEVTPGRD
jgi:hypothetical protein